MWPFKKSLVSRAHEQLNRSDDAQDRADRNMAEAEKQLERALELENMRADIIHRQLRLVEKWEQLYEQVQKLVEQWEQDRPAG